MKTQYIVKAYEEEIGAELFIVTSNKTPEETMSILTMASKYASVDDELTIEEGMAQYDEHYEKIINNPDCGLNKFEQYVQLRGLEIKPMVYDFEFEW